MIETATLLADLTEPQRQAATHVDGPLLILAGAGSGKTRVITRRVAYLVAQGIPPSSVLAITFTNKAAGEMKQRVAAVLDKPLRDWGRLEQPSPMICTFHSLCLRILRHYAVTLGLPANFSVYDSGDQNKVIKEAVKALDLSSSNFPPSGVHGTISRAENQLQTAEDFARQAGGDFYMRNVARVYTKYQAMLRTNQAMDFDDLLLNTALAFRSHPQVLKELQSRFAYILIDEYQDTNHAQYILAHAMAQGHRNICVVGDPDQSIYAWRGADIRNLLDFEKDYPDATVVKLEQNYRSTKTVLRLASELISRNLQRKEKTLWTENAEGEKAELYLCEDEHDEAEQIARRLRELNEEGYAWNSMAILYRVNALSRVMEDALRRGQIPYQIARGVEFYNRKEIKDVLAYLRAIANPDDEVNLSRIVNVPTRGLGDAAIKSMQAWAVGHGVSLWEALRRAGEIGGPGGVSSRAANGAVGFVKLMESFRAKIGGPVKVIMDDVIKRSGLEAMLLKEDPDREDQVPNVNELVSSAAEYDAEHPEGSLNEYLAAVSLVSDADHLEGTGGAVTLMTLHAAKGLEFPVIAMIGLEEGCLPHSRARESINEMEEERRLCFVGITRAQERLIFSNAAWRTIRGLRERTVSSPFLSEMPRDMLKIVGRQPVGGDNRWGGTRYQAAREETLGTPFKKGQLVRHPTFGLGRITEISGSGQLTRADVEFNSGGRKRLILQYAKLEPVG